MKGAKSKPMYRVGSGSIDRLIPQTPIGRCEPARGSIAIATLLILVPPFVLGGRYASGQLVIVLLIIAWAAAWLISCIREGVLQLEWSWGHLVVLGGVGLAIAQIVPLGPATLDALSPRIRELLPLWTGQHADAASGGLGPWPCLSLTPSRTVQGLAIFLCLGAVWFLAVHQLRTLEQVRVLLAVVFGVGVGLAAFGLVQWALGDRRLFWTFDVPGIPTDRQLRGPFTNRNHFAGFLALAVGPGCYWIAELAKSCWPDASPGRSSTVLGSRRFPREARLFAVVVGLAMILGTALLSLSRGGALAAVLALLCAGAGQMAVRRTARNRLAVLGLVCLFLVGCLSLVGLPAISQRLITTQWDRFGTGGEPEGRLRLWAALLRAACDFPIFGTGFGSHRYVYPLYMPSPADYVFTHAENCYLQLWVEGGLVALNLVVAAMLLVGCWIVRAVRFGDSAVQSVAVAIGGSMLVAAVHATVDFVWYVPAYAVMVLMLAASAYRLSQLATAIGVRRYSVLSMPRRAGWAMAALLLPVGYIAVTHFVHETSAELAWFDYLRRLAVTDRTPERDAPHERAARAERLQRCLAARPGDTEAHFKLAQIYASQAADASEGDRERCLSQAQGHCREAVRLCPLLGEVYLALASQCAAQPDRNAAMAYAIQAVRVRPYQPEICFAAGYELFKQQCPTAALTAWRLAANRGWEWEQRVIELVAPHADPPSLVRYLNPSPRGLVWAADHCADAEEQIEKGRELLRLARGLIEHRKADPDPGELLLLRQVCKRLGDLEAADQAMDRFVQAGGRAFESLLEQARWYLATGRAEQALHLLERCRAERPNDAGVVRLLQESADSSQPTLKASQVETRRK